MVLTFEHADDAASFLTIICWKVAMCTGPQVELTAHMHGVEWSAKVFWQAAGQHCSKFAPSGLLNAADGLFISEQRGVVNMLFFF